MSSHHPSCAVRGAHLALALGSIYLTSCTVHTDTVRVVLNPILSCIYISIHIIYVRFSLSAVSRPVVIWDCYLIEGGIRMSEV